MPRTAEIIAVGSELLTGGVTNTNARFLSELLTAAGVDVLYHTAVGDDENRLEAAVTAAARRAKDSVMTAVTAVREGADDIYAEAKAINERRAEAEAAAVVEDASAEESKAE